MNTKELSDVQKKGYEVYGTIIRVLTTLESQSYPNDYKVHDAALQALLACYNLLDYLGVDVWEKKDEQDYDPFEDTYPLIKSPPPIPADYPIGGVVIWGVGMVLIGWFLLRIFLGV